jgi:hypothetical protein
MQNDYLSNKNIYTSNKHKKYFSQNHIKLKKKSNVDINKLLNSVKINERNKKKESWILFGLATLIVSVMGIFITL